MMPGPWSDGPLTPDIRNGIAAVLEEDLRYVPPYTTSENEQVLVRLIEGTVERLRSPASIAELASRQKVAFDAAATRLLPAFSPSWRASIVRYFEDWRRLAMTTASGFENAQFVPGNLGNVE